MHITTTSVLSLLFSISLTLQTTLAIPTPAPAPASRTTKEDLSYLAELFSRDQLTPNFRLRSDSQFPLADPTTNKKICGRAHPPPSASLSSSSPIPQCCCMFLHIHTQDPPPTQPGAHFWGDGPGAEDAMITCGLDEGTGICEEEEG
ncbi:hypothetical protein CJF31_00005439 [Rutstroemia sp. NJR-2017a BVV2]|nr:hypothetical protein CJF31_00005439 [Rutstroemia sp. NJR-2017a BVV2]